MATFRLSPVRARASSLVTGGGASFDDGVTRFGGGVTLPCHVLKKGNVGNIHSTYISFTKEINVIVDLRIFQVGRRRRRIMNRINVPRRKQED